MVLYMDTYKKTRGLAMLLGGITIFTIASLPVIRGYYYLGAGDSLSYLGRGMMVLENAGGLSDFIYPGLQSLAIVLSMNTGMRLEWAFMITPMVFSIVFILFSYLLVSSIVSNAKATPIAFCSSLLLLPVNQVSQAGVFFQPYPTLLALLFLPAVFYIIFLYDKEHKIRSALLLITATFAILLFHPQQAANVLIVLLMTSLFQLLIMYTGLLKLPIYRPFYSQTLIFGSVFWLWASIRPKFEQSVSGLVTSLLFDTGTTGDVESAGLSLGEIGTSIEELFLKLFLVSFIYCVLAGSLMIWYLKLFFESDKRRNLWEGNKVPLYLTIGFGPILVLFLSYLAFSSQYFRHLGFIMVIATILGSVALYHIVDSVGFNKVLRSSLATIFVVFLLLSVMTLHMSPYIYQASPHVSEGQVSGFESTFEVTESDDLLVTVRSSPSRYGHAINGRSYSVNDDDSPDHFADRNLTGYYEGEFYVTITRVDRLRDPVLYNGFRFSEEDFDYLDRESEIHHVYSNGQFDLYRSEGG